MANYRFTERDRENITQRLGVKLDYLHWQIPCPLFVDGPLDVVMDNLCQFMPDDFPEAIRLGRKYGSFQSHEMVVRMPSNLTESELSNGVTEDVWYRLTARDWICLRMPGGLMWPGSSHQLYRVDTESPRFHEMVKWTCNYIKLTQNIQRARSFLQEVVTNINTGGQWNRLWPSVIQYLPQTYQDIAKAQVKRSQLPEAYKPPALLAEFRGRAEKVEHMIATGLLLASVHGEGRARPWQWR